MLDTEYIEAVLKGKEGLEFQKYCENYLRKKYGGDFQEVASKGRLGDGGRDGYVFKTKEYFAISSQVSDVAAKIRSDFESCMKKNFEVKKFIFVSNQKIGSLECDVIDKMKINYPDIKIETMSHRHIAKELINYTEREVLTLLGKPVPFLDDRMVYFSLNDNKEMSFTLSQAIKDSIHFYAVFLIAVALMLGIMFYFSTELLKNVLVVLLFVILLLYLYFNIDSLRKYKSVHKILYLLVSGKLCIDDEILFDDETHKTIRRDSNWSFTINKRSADCIKRGCSSKVHLYRSESNTLVGRCNKDGVNHTYQVDNNFYGELL